MSEPAPVSSPDETLLTSRWRAAGRFFRDGDSGETVFVKAVTYGPFPPGEEPDTESELRRVRDELGANALRLYELPDRDFLDHCAAAGLRAFVTFPWSHHVDFFADPGLLQEEKARFRRAVEAFCGHPAVAGWFVANEIPAPLVRWMGPRRVNRVLEEFIEIGHQADPDALFSYANYPSTEYLCPRGQDFIGFNIYLEDREAYARYLHRLQHLAADKPLFIAEFGLDSQSHGDLLQAEVLAWQVMETALAGAAGTTLFAWSDRWFRGGESITGWDFGLTRRDGSAKPALSRVAETWRDWHRPSDALPSDLARPKMSIVVCSYRGARMLKPCLESFRRLRYPDYEVLVVNDGNDVEVAKVAAEFPEARHLALAPHAGLSAARNHGARASTGEIIVYTDDDCEADPDWLTWLAAAFAANDDEKIDAVGGPNIPPPPADPTRAMVAVAPGGPAHVMLDDTRAEHLPGCNLAVRRAAFDAVDGFDERFRTAGDDVDFCWRLLAAGFRIGFHPAAMVWHHRRFTPKAYLRQQLGYGRAEALLMPLYPERFGLRGGARWRGHLYLGTPADRLAASDARIYHGPRGAAPFQALYGDGSAGSPANLSLDWLWAMMIPLLIAAGIGSGFFPATIMGVVMLAVSVGRALILARRAAIHPGFDSTRARLGLAALIFVQGPMRSLRRAAGLLKTDRPAEQEPAVIDAEELAVPKKIPRWRRDGETFAYWSEDGGDRHAWLDAFEAACRDAGLPIRFPEEWETVDLVIGRDFGKRLGIATVTEYHAGGACLTRIRLSTRGGLPGFGLRRSRIADLLHATSAALGWTRL